MRTMLNYIKVILANILAHDEHIRFKKKRIYYPKCLKIYLTVIALSDTGKGLEVTYEFRGNYLLFLQSVLKTFFL